MVERARREGRNWTARLLTLVRSPSDWGLTEGVRLRPTGPHYSTRPLLSFFLLLPLSSFFFWFSFCRFSASGKALPGKGRICLGNPSSDGVSGTVPRKMDILPSRFCRGTPIAFSFYHRTSFSRNRVMQPTVFCSELFSVEWIPDDDGGSWRNS